MVGGLKAFLTHFAGQVGKYVIIGGTACDYWMEKNDLSFRKTRDLDIVLFIEEVDRDFGSVVRGFIEAGRYDVATSGSGSRHFYRFNRPRTSGYPPMIELFCRRPDQIILSAGQKAAPITVGGELASLSAILLDDDYYGLVREHAVRDGDLPVLDVDGLIALKARAWLNMAADRDAGRKVDQNTLSKHRNDVFRMGAILPGSPAERVPLSIRHDIIAFLNSFPANCAEWPAIVQALASSIPVTDLKSVLAIDAALRRRYTREV